MKSTLIFFLCAFSVMVASITNLCAQNREEIPFNDQWSFHGKSVSGVSVDQIVNLPHSWNSQDAQIGIPYYRGNGRYEKSFIASETWTNKRVFIRFEGANITTKVVLNDKEIGSHRGGYAAFIFEITTHINQEEENKIVVTVNNEETKDVIPLVGDFNNYGGIHRPITLIVTDKICISPLDYASPGIYLKQKNVSKKSADIEVLTKINNASGAGTSIDYKTILLSASGEEIESQLSTTAIDEGETDLVHKYQIKNPHLWYGKKDPYMYSVRVDLIKDGVVFDSKTEPLGLRFFSVDANKGFFLNGEHIALHGVSRHQDVKDKGLAVSEADHHRDMDLMLDMGVNALRLAHYQHSETIYDLSDSAGVIVWAEIPWVGMPKGLLSTSNGYENTEAFHNNAKQQLYELIRQNFNHPSILMWSIFNEIQNPEGAEPISFVNALNELVKAEDPSRLTVGASMLNPQKDPSIHKVTDIIAWNRYFGWYYKEPEDMGVFLDQLHKDEPEYKIGISEYGAGGSISQHSDEISIPNPIGTPHPEEFQSYYHEVNYKIFDERPFVWGTYVWNMFDFGSHFRKEGDTYAINDKGLVTYDRKTKKDAFFFYKANWSTEPFVHITSSRYVFRKNKNTAVKVYTNLKGVVLTVNGQDYPAKSPEKGIVIWDGILLSEGSNSIVVKGNENGKTYIDSCVWALENKYAGLNLYVKIFDYIKIAKTVGIVGLVLAFLIWLFGIKRLAKRAKKKRVLMWIVTVLLVLISLLGFALKYYVENRIN